VGPAAGLQLSFVEVHDWSIGPAFAIAETETLVEGAGGNVLLAGTQVHMRRALFARHLDGSLHEPPPETPPASVGDDVELGQIAFESLSPDGRAEPKHRETLRLASSEENRAIAGSEELPDAVGESARAGRRIVELAVEVVQQLTDGVGVRDVRAADGEVTGRLIVPRRLVTLVSLDQIASLPDVSPESSRGGCGLSGRGHTHGHYGDHCSSQGGVSFIFL
jgi:hypothetical protein